ncbi:hypothetical protein [Microvirga sp. TS319]|uniref:hypothetical protein n=1 Tax=Microvirga sp. TS319 TaxID=3241165 RepID=UPI003519E4F7
MRFNVVSTNRPKGDAKRLKRYLQAYGCDLRLATCQDLVAKMLGYRDYNELHHLAGSLPATDGDAQVDDQTRVMRRAHHIDTLVAAGIDLSLAADAIGEIRPTSFGPRCDVSVAQASDLEATTTAFEEEWGLKTTVRPFVVEARKSRSFRPKQRD